MPADFCAATGRPSRIGRASGLVEREIGWRRAKLCGSTIYVSLKTAELRSAPANEQTDAVKMCEAPWSAAAELPRWNPIRGWRIRADGFCRHVCAFPTMGAYIAPKGVATYAPPAIPERVLK